MKQLVFLLIALCLSINVRSQCDTPVIQSWTAINDSTFTITFESSVEGEYLIRGFPPNQYNPQPESFEESGQAIAGINTTTIVIEGLGWDFQAEVVFYLVELRITCNEDLESEWTKIYMSPTAMLNHPEFNCTASISPLEFIVNPTPNDTVDFPIDISIDEEIENVSLYLDFEQSYEVPGQTNHRIELVHPSGASVVLQDSTSYLKGLSAIYTDLSNIPVEFSPQGNAGFYQASEPLSGFNGLPSEGEWKIRFISLRDHYILEYSIIYQACLSINSPPCTSSLGGDVFVDLNANGTLDNQEFGIANAQVQNNPNGSIFHTNSQGSFWECIPLGEGSINLVNVPEYYEVNSLDYNLSSGDYLTDQNIALTPSTLVKDLSVDLFSLDPNRPGFEASYRLTLQNIGTLCEASGTLEIEFPDYVEILSSTNTELTISGNAASLEMVQLCPFEPFAFDVEVILDNTVSLGTILEATATIVTSDQDVDMNNNVFRSSVEVVGSYDPNDKQVSAEIITDEFMSENNPLKYTIRFQNTGTFYAERVVIADTIDSNLDINSLQIISTSHNMELSREDNVLYFEFDQIFLPDSTTDFEGSNGHVRYTMNPISSFSEGETIENTAYIYFDFNEPIVTNTVETVYANPLSTIDQVDFDLKVFPNPASDVVTVTWSEKVEPDFIEIMDLSGRLIDIKRIGQGTSLSTLDVSQLESGLYLIRLSSENSGKTIIFIRN